MTSRPCLAFALYDQVATTFSDSDWAPKALLQKKAAMKSAPSCIAIRGTLGSVPSSLVTCSATERYPSADGAEAAFARLAELYDDLKRLRVVSGCVVWPGEAVSEQCARQRLAGCRSYEAREERR